MSSLNHATLRWRKSSHSGGNGGECVEIAAAAGRLLVRDSKNPAGTVMSFRSEALGALFSGIRAHER
ncbi:DUF397 domain-containing protein [Actinocorallia sp. B10E7]|uniref:DUF397 domain-containing protein n=1 Tax=Actinocorallia sp. B10E7 TaxID=3153558 RepID=UPI00325DB102